MSIFINEHRFYRDFSENKRWQSYQVKVESTDLYIRTQGNYAREVKLAIERLRSELERHIQIVPQFLDALEPVRKLPDEPSLIARMNEAAKKAHVGPMASVAGAIAEFVGFMLARKSKEVIVENGGDVFMRLQEPAVNIIYAGNSSFSGRLGIKIKPDNTPLGVCTSSGVIGHSMSRGKADAVTVIAGNTCLADAVATGTANMIYSENDFQAALDYALAIEGIQGVILLHQDKMAVQGDVELVKI